MRRCQIARKLERMAILAEDMTVDLPTLPVCQWLDGTFKDPAIEVSFEPCDLARLLQLIADFGCQGTELNQTATNQQQTITRL